MRRFELIEPVTLHEATEALSQDPDRRAIAGGTALLILIKQGIYVPRVLVNLAKVRDAQYIEFAPSGGLRIGALAQIVDIERHPSVRRHYSVLADAAHKVANIRIRSLATIGGNLAHADPQSDPATVLMALGGSVVIVGPGGERRLLISEFLRGPYETALAPGELVKEILLPPPDPAVRAVYVKFVTRSASDRPYVGVAAAVRCADGVVERLRVVLGAVGGVPVLAAATERHLVGARPTAEAIATASELAMEGVEPIGDLRGSEWYKRRVVPVVVRRALERILQADGSRLAQGV